jgi:predicted nucleic acid-binding protein
VFKWTQPGSAEADAPAAMELLRAHLESESILHAPSLIFYEVANGLLLGRARSATDVVEQSLAQLFDIALQVVPPDSANILHATRISRELGLTLYDATYLALAESLGCELVTADRRFVRRAARGGRVRLLGAIG